MPYAWTDDRTAKTLRLWPHQSLTGRGFIWFIGATACMLALPLLAVLGSPVVWVLLGFFAAALAGVWQAIMRNRHHRSVHEAVTIEGDRLHVSHVPPDGPAQEWTANPYWVSVHLRDDGPVEKYLTLRGGGREIEIGRFLTPEERVLLYDELFESLRAR